MDEADALGLAAAVPDDVELELEPAVAVLRVAAEVVGVAGSVRPVSCAP